MLWYMSKRPILINLLVLLFMWSTVSFNYYLIAFLIKSLPGNVYVNTYMSSVGEIIAVMVAGCGYKYMGL